VVDPDNTLNGEY
jgi:hypothetical protein